jgi:hypothetical protein
MQRNLTQGLQIKFKCNVYQCGSRRGATNKSNSVCDKIRYACLSFRLQKFIGI